VGCLDEVATRRLGQFDRIVASADRAFGTTYSFDYAANPTGRSDTLGPSNASKTNSMTDHESG